VALRLIEEGADISATTNYDKWTPLHVAARYRQEAVALRLIEEAPTSLPPPPTATSGHRCTWPRGMGKRQWPGCSSKRARTSPLPA